MKKLFFIFALTSFIAFSQTNNPITTDNENFSGDTILLITENNTINGSKYLLEDWNEGYIILSDSIFSHQDNILFDQLEGAIVLKAKDGSGFKVRDYSVTGFVIEEKGKYIKHYFSKVPRSSFKNAENKTKFYEVVNNLTKTNYLIKDTQKYVFDPNLSKGAGTNNNFAREYKEKTTYYLKNKSEKYVKTRLSKKAVLKSLGDKTSELKKYISSNKINFKNEFDVVKVLNYYHKL